MRRLLITTVKRGMPVEDSGAAYVYDLDTDSVICKSGMLPLQARIPRNPRGGIRGVRGSCIDETTEQIYALTNDTITVLDYDLNPSHCITHPWFSNLHDVCVYKQFEHTSLIIASCGNDAILKYDLWDGQVSQLLGYPLDPNVNYSLPDLTGSLRPNCLCLYEDTVYITYANLNIVTGIKIPTREIFKVKTPITKHLDLCTYHNSYILDRTLSKNKDRLYEHSLLINLSNHRELIFKLRDFIQGTVIYTDNPPFFYWPSNQTSWGWLRGLDVSVNKIAVGSSPYGRVLLFDRNDLSIGKNPKIVKLSKDKNESVYSVKFFKEDCS